MENQEFCFECLEKRIRADFSDKLTFVYGISNSPLPFGCAAVVQLNNCSGDASPTQFILKYVPRRKDDCLTKYMEEFCLDDLEGNPGSRIDDSVSAVIHDEKTEVSADISSATMSTDSQYFSNGGRSTSLLGSENLTCNFSGWYSCFRTITALVPVARIVDSSVDSLEEVALSFLSGSVEENILGSLRLIVEGKPAGREGINFLKLIGVPSFNEINLPGCIRHPNIAPVLGMLKQFNEINVLLPKIPYTLENVLHYSPGVLKCDWHLKFLVYQILSALSYMHSLGIAYGNLCPSNIMMNDLCWCWLHIGDKLTVSSELRSKVEKSNSFPSLSCSSERCSSQGLFADLRLSQPIDWPSSFYRWYNGELSNFEYLLILNKIAGRRWGDHTFYPVMPWIVDFSVKPNENSDVGWRDLSKSKWRLAKGDEQLDFTYSTSEIPHHVSDECLSELAVCSYKARRLPLSVLRMAVRSVYEPNEYPSSMQRLYQWTPDECIPEFYCDPRVFYSQHSGMSNLAVPSWAGTPEEFIKLHRNALESCRVSSLIHHWIDITFGYKMSGQAAIDAKNVMLPHAAPMGPSSTGRRQLFTIPHPSRHFPSRKMGENIIWSPNQASDLEGERSLKELEEAALFCEHARYLSPLYYSHSCDCPKNNSLGKELKNENLEKWRRDCCVGSVKDFKYLIENIEVDDETASYQELLLWKQRLSCSDISSKDVVEDIFAVGCILAELHLKKPLFDPVSSVAYMETGTLPRLMQELPHEMHMVVEACILQDWKRRPAAKCLLESPFFPSTVRSSYLFLAPLQLIAKHESRLQHVATFALQGALRAMGSFAAEICTSYCLPLITTSLSDAEAEWAYILLEEFLKSLNPEAIRELLLPVIQKILQATVCSHLKVSLLQGSFVVEIWNRVGKQAYLEKIHPSVLSNLYIAPHKSSAAAASVLLIGSCEELGVPITVHQTILPLLQCFGKGLCDDGIDSVVRIGCLFGENFIVKQILPLVRNVVQSCISSSSPNRPDSVQSWSTLALINCLVMLDGLVAILSNEMIIKELIENDLYAQILMQKNMGLAVLQVAANKLIAACEQIGPDLTELYVMPRLKDLFDELAFSQENTSTSTSALLGGILKGYGIKEDEEYSIKSRMDLVLLLYPSFASLLGIEKLRQCCATWLLLEQFLLRQYNWKLEYSGEPSQGGLDTTNSRKSSSNKSATTDYIPAKLLLNGVGWSIPQSRGNRGARNLVRDKQFPNQNQRSDKWNLGNSNLGKHEPWYWFPTPASSLEGLDLFGRAGGSKDELPWKIRASVIHSVRAHHGALRAMSVCQDECTIFTAGVGPGFKGNIQKWELARINCISGYYGHEEVVNDICVLPSSGRVASCDGTVHVWNGQTGKLISVFSESSSNSLRLASSSSSSSKTSTEETNTLHYNPLTSGLLNTTFDESYYSCMHYSHFLDLLIVGSGNGSLRFLDINHGKKLHLWRSKSNESSFPSLVSCICSSGSAGVQAKGADAFPSWIAAGLSSGNCMLFDARSGNTIASWQAHDGYVTKVAAPCSHMLVSSSLDRTLRIWDLRRNWTSELVVYKGHSDSISSFLVWGQDIISISRNRIGLSSLARSGDEEGKHRISPQYLYMADQESKNLSVLSSISILPYSRLFLFAAVDELCVWYMSWGCPINKKSTDAYYNLGGTTMWLKQWITRPGTLGNMLSLGLLKSTLPKLCDCIGLLSGQQIAMADLIISDQDGIIASASESPPTHYTVRLQSLSQLAKNNIEKYSTSEFEAAGYKWKLIIYPNGNKNKSITDYISLYLMLVENSLSQRGSTEVHAVIKIFLLDQNKDNYFTLEANKGRRFHKMKLETGFDRFLPLKTFNDPSNGYIVNDTCIFGAQIHVYKETTSGKGESLQMMKDPITRKYRWTVWNYSKIDDDCHESLPFSAGDYKWKMQIYPQGKGTGTGNHISLYLALAKPTDFPIGTHQIYAEFTLRIIDQLYSNNYYAKANYWFSASSPLCGWPRFVSLGYFNLSSNGLLRNDSCTLEAEVTVHGMTTAL